MLYEKLNYVMAIAEERNLTRAAKKLFISQPALTLYLNRLEEELGVKLFDRSKSPLTITPAGQYYIEKMEPIYLAEKMVRNDIKMVAFPTGKMTFGIGQVRGSDWLPILFPALCERFPSMDLAVVHTQEKKMIPALKSGEIDLGIGVFPTSTSPVHQEPLFEEGLVIAAHKSLGIVEEAKRGEFSLENPCLIEEEQLQRLPVICPAIDNGLYLSYEKIFHDEILMPSRHITVSNMLTGFKLCQMGLGVQLVSTSTIYLEQRAGRDLSNMDFCVVSNMPKHRLCTAAYLENSALLEPILYALEVIKEKIIPQGSCPKENQENEV